MVIDIIAFIFVTLFAYFSMKKGAVGAALKLAGIVLSLFVSFLIYPVVTGLVYMTPIPEKAAEPIEQAIIERGNAEEMRDTIDAMPDFIKKSAEIAAEAGGSAAAHVIAMAAARVVISIVVFIILAAAVRILILLLTGALKISAKLPVIKECNAAIGLILGLAASFVLLWAASAVICAFAASNELLYRQAADSYVVSIMSLFSPF